MAWDAKREVPWGRLFREWLVYATVMVLVFVVFLRDTVTGGSILGLAASFPMYLGFGFILAKFGYQRKTLKGLRSEIPSHRTSESSAAQQHRDRPAPTRRTSTGPSQHRPANKPKRR
jgi:hypothetical protein